MNTDLVEQIASAVLYEGYILYPYRPSVKNQQRWTFGGIYPRAYSESQNGSDACSMQAECIVRGSDRSEISLSARFLHLTARTVEKADEHSGGFDPVPSLDIEGKTYHAWQEAVERNVEAPTASLGDLLREPRVHHFSFDAARSIEILRDGEGKIAGRLIRDQQRIEGVIEYRAQREADAVFRFTCRLLNTTDFAEEASEPADDRGRRDAALMCAFASSHMVLGVKDGGFVSPTDPPEALREIASRCRNIGCWPVLVGRPGSTDTLLASPIILYDYPELAPQSPGDLFDGCEIDEILTLRIMTLTDSEKSQAMMADPRSADLMARTQSLAREQLMNLHGVMRGVSHENETTREISMGNWDPLEERKALEEVLSAGIELKPGDRVRLRPRAGGDIMDIALAGKAATIAAIEQDYENRIHLAVTVDDDPGSDLGLAGKPGHRFFFSPGEVEVIADEETRP